MKRLTTVAAVLLALVAAGCSDKGNDGGSSSGASGTNSSSSSDSGGDDIAALTTSPEIDQSNPQAAKDGLVAYLAKLETSLDGMASAVSDAGTPPVDGGEAAVNKFLDQISTAKDSVTSAKSKIEAAPVDDPAAFQAAAAEANQDLQALSNMGDPTASFSENKELNAAYNKAKSCKELEDSVSSPTS
jgi:hypothetical protein